MSYSNQKIAATFNDLVRVDCVNGQGGIFIGEGASLPATNACGSVQFPNSIHLISPSVGLTLNTYVTAGNTCNVGNALCCGCGMTTLYSNYNTVSTAPGSVSYSTFIGSNYNNIYKTAITNTLIGTNSATLIQTADSGITTINTQYAVISALYTFNDYNSHNLSSIGLHNNTTTINTTNFSVVSGRWNAIQQNCDTILLGGLNNTYHLAGSPCALIIGGSANDVKGSGYTLVSNGHNNVFRAISDSSATLGHITNGYNNILSGSGVIITGRNNVVDNTTSGSGMIIAGNDNTIIQGTASNIFNGVCNLLSGGQYSTIIGGIHNYARTNVISTGGTVKVLNGAFNCICICNSNNTPTTIFSGISNNITQQSPATIIGTGNNNSIHCSTNALVSTGLNILLSSSSNIVVDTGHNITTGCTSNMGCFYTGNSIGWIGNLCSAFYVPTFYTGLSNCSKGYILDGVIYTGCNNIIDRCFHTTIYGVGIGGGRSNLIQAISGDTDGQSRNILGGCNNCIIAHCTLSNAAIIGGRNNLIASPSITIIGSNISTEYKQQIAYNDRLFVNNLILTNIPTASAGLVSGTWWVCAGDDKIRRIP